MTDDRPAGGAPWGEIDVSYGAHTPSDGCKDPACDRTSAAHLLGVVRYRHPDVAMIDPVNGYPMRGCGLDGQAVPCETATAIDLVPAILSEARARLRTLMADAYRAADDLDSNQARWVVGRLAYTLGLDFEFPPVNEPNNRLREQLSESEVQLAAARDAIAWTDDWFGPVIAPFGCPCQGDALCPLHAALLGLPPSADPAPRNDEAASGQEDIDLASRAVAEYRKRLRTALIRRQEFYDSEERRLAAAGDFDGAAAFDARSGVVGAVLALLP